MPNITHVWGYSLFSRVMQEASGVYTVLKTWGNISGLDVTTATTEILMVHVIHLKWVRSPPPAWLGHSICSLLLPRVTYTKAPSDICVPSLGTAGLKGVILTLHALTTTGFPSIPWSHPHPDSSVYLSPSWRAKLNLLHGALSVWFWVTGGVLLLTLVLTFVGKPRASSYKAPETLPKGFSRCRRVGCRRGGVQDAGQKCPDANALGATSTNDK